MSDLLSSLERHFGPATRSIEKSFETNDRDTKKEPDWSIKCIQVSIPNKGGLDVIQELKKAASQPLGAMDLLPLQKRTIKIPKESKEKEVCIHRLVQRCLGFYEKYSRRMTLSAWLVLVESLGVQAAESGLERTSSLGIIRKLNGCFSFKDFTLSEYNLNRIANSDELSKEKWSTLLFYEQFRYTYAKTALKAGYTDLAFQVLDFERSVSPGGSSHLVQKIKPFYMLQSWYAHSRKQDYDGGVKNITEEIDFLFLSAYLDPDKKKNAGSFLDDFESLFFNIIKSHPSWVASSFFYDKILPLVQEPIPFPLIKCWIEMGIDKVMEADVAFYCRYNKAMQTLPQDEGSVSLFIGYVNEYIDILISVPSIYRDLLVCRKIIWSYKLAADILEKFPIATRGVLSALIMKIGAQDLSNVGYLDYLRFLVKYKQIDVLIENREFHKSNLIAFDTHIAGLLIEYEILDRLKAFSCFDEDTIVVRLRQALGKLIARGNIQAVLDWARGKNDWSPFADFTDLITVTLESACQLKVRDYSSYTQMVIGLGKMGMDSDGLCKQVDQMTEVALWYQDWETAASFCEKDKRKGFVFDSIDTGWDMFSGAEVTVDGTDFLMV